METKKQKGSRAPLIAAGAVLAAAIVLLNLFTYQFAVVRYYGDGMAPALENGQLLLLRRTSRARQGDVIAFYYNNRLLVRRVVAAGGTQVSVDSDGVVTVNGAALEELYLTERSAGQCSQEFPCFVPPDSFFVMGDNRTEAMDSRLKEIGTVPADRILGKVLFLN